MSDDEKLPEDWWFDLLIVVILLVMFVAIMRGL